MDKLWQRSMRSYLLFFVGEQVGSSGAGHCRMRLVGRASADGQLHYVPTLCHDC